MNFATKIEEWLKEAEARPASALTILRLAASRLRDLSERYEEILAENIALQDGTRAQEYQKRIAHLEYQLDLLKRRVGSDALEMAEAEAARPKARCLLAYNAQGRVLRFDLEPGTGALGRIEGELASGGEFPRLLGLAPDEDAVFLFTSGRVLSLPVGGIPPAQAGGWRWDAAALPAEPRAGEQLACILPFSALPVSAYFLQASRRGCVKKTATSMAQTVLDNHFLGRGVIQKSDLAFDLLLCSKKARAALVSYEGRALGLDVEALPYALEERLRLDALDYVVAACLLPEEATLLCMTQTGKVVSRPANALEFGKSSLSRGQALIPPARLSQGVRFIGAAAVAGTDRLAVLEASGALSLHRAGDLLGAGAVKADGLVLSIGLVAGEGAHDA